MGAARGEPRNGKGPFNSKSADFRISEGSEDDLATDSIFQDIRYAVRRLRRALGLAPGGWIVFDRSLARA